MDPPDGYSKGYRYAARSYVYLSMVVITTSVSVLLSVISLSSFSTSVKEYNNTGPLFPVERNIYPLLLGNKTVLLFDSIWIPGSSQVALLGVSKKMFQHKFTDQKFKFRKEQSVPVNITFTCEDLRSPMTLLPNLSWDSKMIQNCRNIESEVNDSNCKDKIFTVICDLPENESDQEKAHLLEFNGQKIGQFHSLSRSFNSAMKGMLFSRNENMTSTLSIKIRLSVVIKPIKLYHPVLPDMIDYYRRQGVQHVYIGLVNPSQETILQFTDNLLPKYDGFVSLGWHESSDMVFNDTHTHTQTADLCQAHVHE